MYKQEGLGDMTIRDLMRVADRVFNTWETPEEREDRLRKEDQELQQRVRKGDRKFYQKQNKQMAKILLAKIKGKKNPRGPQNKGTHPKVDINQCACCKKYGH